MGGRLGNHQRCLVSGISRKELGRKAKRVQVPQVHFLLVPPRAADKGGRHLAVTAHPAPCSAPCGWDGNGPSTGRIPPPAPQWR